MFYVIYGQYVVAKYDNLPSAVDKRYEEDRDVKVMTESEALMRQQNINGFLDDIDHQPIDDIKEMPCSPDPYQHKKAISK